MPFLLAEILNFQGSTHRIGVGSFSYEVYVGETNDILRRTREHYAEGKRQGGWRKKMLRSRASLYIIGHEHFNKSMTLDIENRLMMYLMSVECIRKIHNRRGNAQGKYYPVDETDNIFHCIWQKLRSDNEEVFPSEERIKDSALFKASPLHRLTDEQLKVKENAYWEFVPTVDHIVPVALGGADAEENWATTSMLHNAVKSNWTLEQLNWSLCDPGDFKEFDGLTKMFVQLVQKDEDLLKDSYIKRWYNLSITYVQGE